MFTDIAINLIAAFLGFLLAQAYAYLRGMLSGRTLRWFWAPGDQKTSKIFLFHGERRDVLSEEGELESFMNTQDALTLGELRRFLESYYSEVIVTSNQSTIDWQHPVVSLGGPLPTDPCKTC